MKSYKSLDDYDLQKMGSHAAAGNFFVLVVYTCGDREAPRNVLSFWLIFRLLNVRPGQLSNLGFPAFSLGDRAHIKFNHAARPLKRRIAELGGYSVFPIGVGDCSEEYGHNDHLIPWQEQIVKCVCFDKPVLSVITAVGTGKPTARVNVCIDSGGKENETCEIPDSNTNLWCHGGSRLATPNLPLVVNDVVTNTTFACKQHKVRHIELDNPIRWRRVKFRITWPWI